MQLQRSHAARPPQTVARTTPGLPVRTVRVASVDASVDSIRSRRAAARQTRASRAPPDGRGALHAM